MTIESQIERYLLEAPGAGWIKSAELVAVFDLGDERQLRAVGRQEGLCSAFAISGDKGFKHVERATTAEYRKFKHRLRKHAVAEFRRTNNLDRRRAGVIKSIKRPQFTAEKDTGQGLLFALSRPGPPR